jgi:hypothetical protein
MPIHTYQKEFHRQNDWWGIFQFRLPSAELMQASKDEARMLMRARRHRTTTHRTISPSGFDSIMALWHDLTGTLASAAIGIVSVFLVVGAS